MEDANTLQSLTGWSQDSRDLYHHYASKLLPEGWKEIRSSVGRERNQSLYTLNHPEVGAAFEYVIFFSKEEKKSITVWQFGPKTGGPAGFVHGGAIATAGDTCAGVHLNNGMQVVCVTASLTVNFKRPVPLGSTVVIETGIESVEGRKYSTFSTMKSPDGNTLYDTVSTLFIRLEGSQSNI